jgi:dTDP-4-dehydrorhamnose 3,5-epimerase-like enzyme
MPQVIILPTFTDNRGDLTVIEKSLPFEIKRLFYIYNGIELRGGHRHKFTQQALICVSGICEIFVDCGDTQQFFLLDSPDKCLIVDPKDWHTMKNYSKETVLLVLASENFDKEDYIYEPYN